MSYGTLNTDIVQSSTTGTPPQFNDGSGAQIGTLCRAWVRFAGGASSATINASFNVSSVTRNGTGIYTVNFSNSLPDANYSGSGSSGQPGTQNGYLCFPYGIAPTSSAAQIAALNTSAAAYDAPYISFSVFR